MKLKHCIILVLFAVTGSLPLVCSVERHAQANNVDLLSIPTVIGDWRMVDQNTAIRREEKKFLDDLLVRTYERKDGKALALAIAYGGDQRRNYSMHLPEVCYRATGCDVTTVGQAVMNSPKLKLKQLLVKDVQSGTLPVQYWIVLDGKQVTSELDKKLRHLYYSIYGAKTTGVLVRISSIPTGRNYQADYDVQKDFISRLYRDVQGEQRKLLFGDNI